VAIIVEKPESLCAQILKAKYYPNSCLLDTAFPVDQSVTWKSIVHGLDLLKKGVNWRVGSGDHIRIWRDPWIPRKVTFRPLGRVRSCHLKWVVQLMDKRRGAWKEDVLHRYFWPTDVEEILKIKPSGGMMS